MSRAIIVPNPFPSKGHKQMDFDFTSESLAPRGPVVEEKKPPRAPVVEEKPKAPEPLGPRATSSRHPAVRAIAYAISGSSAIVSAYFSFGFLSTVLPWYVAAPLAAIVIGSATVCPELVLLLSRARRYFLAAFVVIVGLTSSGFSMLTTIAGQYNARSVSGAAIVATDRAEAAEARILDEIARLNRSIDTWQRRIDFAAAEGKKDPDAVYLKSKDEKAKAAREAELGKAQSGIAIEREDFYTWTGRVLKWKSETVEFTLATFPAVLLDITAPVFAIIALVI